MNNIISTIKFLEDRIINNNKGSIQIWLKSKSIGTQYIYYKGSVYNLVNDELENE
jgi:frataxin-like iron-binding protein CyaY